MRVRPGVWEPPCSQTTDILVTVVSLQSPPPNAKIVHRGKSEVTVHMQGRHESPLF